MISDAGDIPEKTTGSFPFTDIASFYDILGGAEEVFVECIKERNQAGWQSAGKSLSRSRIQMIENLLTQYIPIGIRNGIGVFFWASDSQEDSRRPRTSQAMAISNRTEENSVY